MMIKGKQYNFILVLMVALMLGYFYLNAGKLQTLAVQYGDIFSGASATHYQIFDDGQEILDIKLQQSGVFDRSGKKQIQVHRVDEALFEWLATDAEKHVVQVDGVKHKALVSSGHKVIMVDSLERKLFIVRDGDVKTTAAIYAKQSIDRKPFIECLGEPDFCRSIKVYSRDWTGLEGPYHSDEFTAMRRGLPRGRGMQGPQTSLRIMSDRQQQIAVLVRLMSLLPDQKIVFQGSIVTKFQQAKVKVQQLTAGDKQFYPKDYIVYLALQRGDNDLVIRFSKWQRPVRRGVIPLAAYLTGITVKRVDR